MKSRCLLACGLLLVPLSVTAGQTDLYGRDLCTAGEKALFSCPLARKTVSICASRNAATYRFGAPGRIELSTPASGYAFQGYSGGGEAQVKTSKRSVDYIVFTRTVRTAFGTGPNNPESTAGVLVRRGARTIARLRCTPAPDADIAASARKLLPEGRFVEH